MSEAPIARKVVRVTGERNGFVEFEYGVGDLSLALELMLPPEAFEDFCVTNEVEILPPLSAQAKADAENAMTEEERAMSWRPSDVQQHL